MSFVNLTASVEQKRITLHWKAADQYCRSQKMSYCLQLRTMV